MNKTIELNAIIAIIERYKNRTVNDYTNAKNRFNQTNSNSSLTFDELSTIRSLQSELNSMAESATKIEGIKKIEAEVSKIHHTISLGMSGMGNPTEEKLEELEKQWRKQLHNLKTQSPEFKTMMLEEAYIQKQNLAQRQGIFLSLDFDENIAKLKPLLQSGVLSKEDFAAHWLGIGYLVNDPDFIANCSTDNSFVPGTAV